MFLVTEDEIRRIDKFTIKSFKIPGRVLMENAGREAARCFLEIFNDKTFRSIAVIAGNGNNGGDGFVFARYLNQMDCLITVFLLSKKSMIKGDARANLDLLLSLGISVVELPDCDAFCKYKNKLESYTVFVDAIFGIGLNKSISGFFYEVIEFVNFLNKPVFSIDIPSGVNADTGQICGICINSTATVTFGFAKIGHVFYPGSEKVGDLKIVDIGIPSVAVRNVECRQRIIGYNYLKKRFLVRSRDYHKGMSGHLMVVAGSLGKTGAAVMTSLGAMRSGVGLVTLGIPHNLNCMLETMLIEVMTVVLPEDVGSGLISSSAFDVIINQLINKNCIVFGPGIGVSVDLLLLLKKLIINSKIPIVIDADGLNVLVGNLDILKNSKSELVLTPHLGEMARLLNKTVSFIKKDIVSVAREFASRFNIYLVLKGANTVIAYPDGMVSVNLTGNSGMASGGMGDVLAGIIGSFIAQGNSIDYAIEMGVYIHGLSGDELAICKGQYGYLATDLINCIPEQISLFSFNEYIPFPMKIDSLVYEI